MAVKIGDIVKIDYEGRLEDGTVFDSSQHGDHSHPLEFTVGGNQVIPGFEKSIIGMEKGQEKEITIEPQNAYGERNESMVCNIPISALPKDIVPKKGMVLALNSPDGQQVPVPVVNVSETELTIDMNHPLAGKKLIFRVRVIDIQ